MVSKVVKFGKLPVRIALAGQYMVHHPDVGGQKWNIQLMVVPVIPKLIKGNLYGERGASAHKSEAEITCFCDISTYRRFHSYFQ